MGSSGDNNIDADIDESPKEEGEGDGEEEEEETIEWSFEIEPLPCLSEQRQSIMDLKDNANNEVVVNTCSYYVPSEGSGVNNGGGDAFKIVMGPAAAATTVL